MADAIGRTVPAFSAKGMKDVIVLPSTKSQDMQENLHAAMDLLVKDGGEVHKSLKNIAGFTAAIKPGQEKELEAHGLQVVDDRYVQLIPSWRPQVQSFSPQGDEHGPEAIANNQPLPYTGKGVTIAILDSGIYPHPDLKDRIVAFADFATGERQMHDNLGHGTHCAGDAAGNGKMSGGTFHGLAPEANIAAVKVLDSEGSNHISEIVDNIVGGLNWCVENKERYNIKVANMSLHLPLLRHREGGYFGRTELYDPIGEAVDNAVKAGITVVVAAGNDGREGEGTIDGTPAYNPNALTVGALDMHGRPHVADFSSRGPAPDGSVKPDVVAPGVEVMAPNAPQSELDQMNAHSEEMKAGLAQASDRDMQRLAYQLVMNGMAPEELMDMDPSELREKLAESIKTMPTEGQLEGSAAYIGMDGTSMASPVVAGLVADIAQANPNLTPAQIKTILEKTATPLRGEDQYSEGAGAINPQAALKMAEASRGGQPAPAPSRPVQPMPTPTPAPRHHGFHDLMREIFGIAS